MDNPLVIEREVQTDLGADELWRLIATADGWRTWMVDRAAIDIGPGAEGDVIDDGVARRVRIDTMSDRREVTFVWGEPDQGDVSKVSLAIVRDDDGRSRLRITEERTVACAACPLRAAERWELRACLLCFAAQTSCRV